MQILNKWILYTIFMSKIEKTSGLCYCKYICQSLADNTEMR